MTLAISSATHCKTLIQSATLVRNSHPPPLIGDVQPPSLDSSPKTVSGCGWSTMDWLGVGFILVCCVAALIGIAACFCCCTRGRTSNF